MGVSTPPPAGEEIYRVGGKERKREKEENGKIRQKNWKRLKIAKKWKIEKTKKFAKIGRYSLNIVSFYNKNRNTQA